MKYKLLDILSCPNCKNFPLKIHVIRQEKKEFKGEFQPCTSYCSYLNQKPPKNKKENCRECLNTEIIDAIIYCEKCGKWFPVEDAIPIMQPDHYRSKEEDQEFLRKHADKIPENLKEKLAIKTEQP